jgi:quinol monooxygenase YgiN
MMNDPNMIYVIATVSLHSEAKRSYLREISLVLPTIRAERGCLEYEVLEDLSLGLPPEQEARSDVMTIVEKWTDEQALRTHLSAPHMAEYRKRVASIVKSVQLRILKHPAAAL